MGNKRIFSVCDVLDRVPALIRRAESCVSCAK